VKKFLKNPSRTCITAEIGFNHNNNIYLSKNLIKNKKFTCVEAVIFNFIFK